MSGHAVTSQAWHILTIQYIPRQGLKADNANGIVVFFLIIFIQDLIKRWCKVLKKSYQIIHLIIHGFLKIKKLPRLHVQTEQTWWMHFFFFLPNFILVVTFLWTPNSLPGSCIHVNEEDGKLGGRDFMITIIEFQILRWGKYDTSRAEAVDLNWLKEMVGTVPGGGGQGWGRGSGDRLKDKGSQEAWKLLKCTWP